MIFLFIYVYWCPQIYISYQILIVSFNSNTAQMQLVKKELFTLPEHLSSSPILVDFVLINLWFSAYNIVDHGLCVCPFSYRYCVLRTTYPNPGTALVFSVQPSPIPEQHFYSYFARFCLIWLMVFYAIFNNISVIYRDGQFYW